MSLSHAILMALAEKPLSGLELTRRMARSIGYFWTATHQQIYQELPKLERKRMIKERSGPVTRGRRKTYEIQPAGVIELKQWMAEPEDPRPIRDSLLLRLRAAATYGLQDVLPELARHRALHAQQLAVYEKFEAEMQDDLAPTGQTASDQSDEIYYQVLRAGITIERAWVQWLDEALADLGKP